LLVKQFKETRLTRKIEVEGEEEIVKSDEGDSMNSQFRNEK